MSKDFKNSFYIAVVVFALFSLLGLHNFHSVLGFIGEFISFMVGWFAVYCFLNRRQGAN